MHDMHIMVRLLRKYGAQIHREGQLMQKIIYRDLCVGMTIWPDRIYFITERFSNSLTLAAYLHQYGFTLMYKEAKRQTKRTCRQHKAKKRSNQHRGARAPEFVLEKHRRLLCSRK